MKKIIWGNLERAHKIYQRKRDRTSAVLHNSLSSGLERDAALAHPHVKFLCGSATARPLYILYKINLVAWNGTQL